MFPKTLKAAIEFLTIFRVGVSTEEIRREDIADSVMFFPLVGILLGGFCATSEMILRDLITSDLARSLFPLVILALLTRGLHLDGVADCFDALHYAGHDRGKALEIMKGKTIGTFGSSALIVVVVGKVISISALSSDAIVSSLIVIPALSRWTSSIVARERAPAKADGLGYVFSVYSTGKAFLVSGIIALAVSFLLFGLSGIAIFILVSVFSWLLTRYFIRAFGGVTGDVFGAVIELSEVFGFLVAGVVIG